MYVSYHPSPMPNKQLLQTIGFLPKEGEIGIFHKNYSSYSIQVNLENNTINYGGKIVFNNTKNTIQNITKPEDWVVLECVNRLLEKGYKPENIILEKIWPAGHQHSGRLDICVMRDDGTEYLLIECKTYGKEFEKAFDRLNKDGGQLFTYFKFSNKADLIILYASELRGQEIAFRNEIIKIEDDYRAGDVKDFYEKWNKLTKDNGAFDSWVKPYNFESKALTIKNLEEIRQEDSSFIFNRFLEILRHNVVSDKGNAFNRIFTLFLCKIYDEKINEDTDNELGFQWLEGIDDHKSFQLRLSDLYKNGMYEFLEKVVTDFSETEFNNKFNYLSEQQRQPILEEFRKIRLEKNNEFAIKDVYDEQSFNENAVVVKEIVQLLEKYRLRYAKKQQYLSDFFELLLTTGLKQESGQFFTPVPVAQFIIKSLPVDAIVEEKLSSAKIDNDTLLPYVIDYAAGSGHFLTETMHVIQRLIDQKDDTKYHPSVAKKIRNWKDDHFAWAINYIYGIEKDYRLVKVGKVGCYLHGDGLANVIHSDGLARFSHPDYKGKLLQTDKNFPKDNKQFDMLVSNPPYSVSAFKNAARAFYKEESFDLYDSLTDNSSEIEALFVERTKQLLKDGGVAGIILPSSILSNTGIYSKTREIILQYFEIIAITELGSNTFMATGTNTVVLFLRRRNNYDSINLKKAVDKFFTDYKDVTLNGVEKPVSKYIDHVWEGLIFDDYVSLLKREPNKTIKSHEIYKEYRKKLKTKNETDFWKQVLDRETEKLFYFILAYPQKVVLIKSGQKNDEKRFLGYEFSNRRGSEGIHPIQRGKSIVECTKLFDEDNFENEEKASTYIYRAFKGDFESEIHNSLQKNISRQALVDMLTFDNIEFEKNISLAVKKKVKIESKFSLLELKEIVTFSEKGKRPASFGSERGIYPFIGSSAIIKKCDIFDYDFEAIVIGDGGSANIHYLNEKFSSSDHTYILKKKETPLKYIYFFLRQNIEIIEEGFAGQSLKNISKSFLESIKIPLPPLDIQNKIVIEIDALDKKEGKTKEEIKKLKNSFGQLFQGKNYSYKNLGSITSFKNGLNYSRSSLGEVLNIVGVKDFQNNFSPNIELLEKVQIDGQLTEEYELRPQDILVVRSNGSANLVGRFLFIENLPIGKTSFSGFTIRLRPLSDNINSKFLGHYLKTDIVRNELTGSSKGSNIKSLNQTLLSAIKIPVPSLSEQQKIVSEIEKIESKISVLEKEIAEIPKQKDKILKKFL
ncbi:MAG: N-6 DNA methylase [Candidatus Uhrbacteria bacterium GW2011_GWD1_41_16]|uniref:N-6 DNA methylase n=1 Tax=Candidatus Uhrbacteria bacterium GW2011_GWC1_41_20 TaxID=1618983 RepID=A0A0G0V923_9BACT|nr:MAG: N-6 DNA methylase [Candidatus Uhrbacteria bacterium GW2011_GWE1_39_46]KKR63073.1 MAG: N-6 DNA methylase [Candidatus Uhrbacteria bacterium GW2011_GWC2_40_450]KKR88373.1 MAG: N-6 DNA methylase [Candidatus Uhrbacteria bacterium GW2011_GWE2_41_1153]KKR94115.1 MAG: N-6 DNA methylase [Candidatus Uhrbacteria bacterium GW2011_GWD1_41_16]KKR97464.1 MAG: N-6 DNA methylase [Candidatus Uhrbacteria bacterium GW2011_GWC1_41_20]KKS06707.1 MAG: N-6 DNA methylase [Candidatus Uhrbacteria bacterium GW201